MTAPPRTSSSQTPPSNAAHVLLTVLGRNPQLARYSLGDREVEAPLSSLALLKLLPPGEQPQEVLALCTPEAKFESWPVLVEGLRDLPTTLLPPRDLNIPAVDSPQDIPIFLETFVDAIVRRGPTLLTLDVTHGLRHLVLLAYVGTLYLASLTDVTIRGAYYGLLRPGGVSPFLDLLPLLDLPRWIHALEVMRQSGNAMVLAEVIASPLRKSPSRADKLPKDLKKYSEAYATGLPLELGYAATLIEREHIHRIAKLLRSQTSVPLWPQILRKLRDTTAQFALPIPSGSVKESWKSKLVLSEEELRRQGRYIDALFSHRHTATAVGTLREWVISWAILQQHRSDEWLDYPRVRKPVERKLHQLADMAEDPYLSPDQRELGRFWQSLCLVRNAYHHHGMRREVVFSTEGQLRSALENIRHFWNTRLRTCPNIPIDVEQPARLFALLSPLGLRPGALYSAIHCVRQRRGADPARCFVVCSPTTRPAALEAARQAGYGGELVVLPLGDPYSGVGELENLRTRFTPQLANLGDLFVNLTGGTTLMGLAVQHLARVAQQKGVRVISFGLVDRRPTDLQDSDPYQMGDVLWLDELLPLEVEQDDISPK